MAKNSGNLNSDWDGSAGLHRAADFALGLCEITPPTPLTHTCTHMSRDKVPSWRLRKCPAYGLLTDVQEQSLEGSEGHRGCCPREVTGEGQPGNQYRAAEGGRETERK